MWESGRYEEEICEQFLNVLGEFFNDVHGEKHARHYWAIILRPWLIHYIQALHERYLCLRNAFERFPDLKTTVLSSSSFKTPRHFGDHLLGCQSDIYNLQLYSDLLRAMDYQFPDFDFAYNWTQVNIKPKVKIRNKGLKTVRFLSQRYGLYWAKKASILMVDMYVPIKQVMKLMRAMKFRARWSDLPKCEQWIGDVPEGNLHPRRQELGDLPIRESDPFFSVMLRTLPTHFPLIYVEGYHRCRRWVIRMCKGTNIKMLLTANAFDFNETFKFLAAELKEQGTKLIGIQHGGSYGTALYDPVEIYETKASDEFWSWGWGKGHEYIRPMPSHKISILSKNVGTAKRDKRYILYIGNAYPRYHYRTWSHPSANQVLQYLDESIEFIRGLRANVRRQLIYRPHFWDYGWNIKDRLLDAVPDLRLDSPPSDYSDMLLGATLVICDQNETSFLESLGCNIPTIAFWDRNCTEIREEAEPYFQLLHDTGILHYCPDNAAKALNTLWPHIDDWWLKEEIQIARKKFVKQYAFSSLDWVQEWCECLTSLC